MLVLKSYSRANQNLFENFALCAQLNDFFFEEIIIREVIHLTSKLHPSEILLLEFLVLLIAISGIKQILKFFYIWRYTRHVSLLIILVTQN